MGTRILEQFVNGAWEESVFSRLCIGDRFRLWEDDIVWGAVQPHEHPVKSSEGLTEFICDALPKKDSNGVWGVDATPAVSLTREEIRQIQRGMLEGNDKDYVRVRHWVSDEEAIVPLVVIQENTKVVDPQDGWELVYWVVRSEDVYGLNSAGVAPFRTLVVYESEWRESRSSGG